MFCNRAGLLLTMHPLRRLAMSANIVMNIFFGCRGLFLSGTKYNQDIIITYHFTDFNAFHSWMGMVAGLDY